VIQGSGLIGERVVTVFDHYLVSCLLIPQHFNYNGDIVCTRTAVIGVKVGGGPEVSHSPGQTYCGNYSILA
jgi:hypothetical protein